MPKGTFHLPVELAVIVPSTKDKSKPITSQEFESRTQEVRKILSYWFGGNTQVKAEGGFLLKGKEIRERVNIVYAFSKTADWLKNRDALKRYLMRKKKSWQQFNIGLQYETDLFYL